MASEKQRVSACDKLEIRACRRLGPRLHEVSARGIFTKQPNVPNLVQETFF